MLKVVCDRCGKELNSERMDSDEYAFVAYVEGSKDPVLAYEDLCDGCREEIIELIQGKPKPKKEKPKPKKAPEKPVQLPIDEDEPDGVVVNRTPVRGRQ